MSQVHLSYCESIIQPANPLEPSLIALELRYYYAFSGYPLLLLQTIAKANLFSLALVSF